MVKSFEILDTKFIILADLDEHSSTIFYDTCSSHVLQERDTESKANESISHKLT